MQFQQFVGHHDPRKTPHFVVQLPHRVPEGVPKGGAPLAIRHSKVYGVLGWGGGVWWGFLELFFNFLEFFFFCELFCKFFRYFGF